MKLKKFNLDSKAKLGYLERSYWFEGCNFSANSRTMEESEKVDIAIVGGGFVGLWTAINLKKTNPKLRVIILERDVCGGGASGRNGGFAMSWWPKISTLLNICSTEDAKNLAISSQKAIHEIGQFCKDHNIDADYCEGGWLWTATNDSQLDSWANTIRACESVGYAPFSLINRDELVRRTGSPLHIKGVLEKSNATIHPMKLVNGLKQVALKLGVEIFEKTPVLELSLGNPAILKTANTEVCARKVVIASNAWACAIPQIAKMITPVSSAIVVTEKIPEQLRKIGWTGGESITDSQLMVDYYRTTKDGRIVFGKGTGCLSRNTGIDMIFSRDKDAENLAEIDFRRTYPQLDNFKLEYQWTGPIDRTYDSLPVFGTLENSTNIFYGVGWSGNGVAPSYIGGKILSSLCMEISNEWSRCALVDRKVRNFPNTYVRYWGGNLVRDAIIRKEKAESIGNNPSWMDISLAKLAPSGLEDKS